MRARRTPVLALSIILVAGAAALTQRSCAEDEVVAQTEPTVRERLKTKIVSAEERAATLRRAAAWRSPGDVGAVRFAQDLTAPRAMSCRFVVSELGGTTPKFDCTLDNGELIRVKYGRGPELPAEVAATHLLRALGFGADTVNFVESLRCYGCPKEPFSTMKAVELTRAEQIYKGLMLNYGSYETFTWPTVERKFGGRPIASDAVEGWNLFELETIDASQGGAPRAHLDALRLMTVFLAHWDNKPENQRLVCLSQNEWGNGERCERPFALLQDVGATFGPHKVDLPKWQNAAIWENREQCTTSMRDFPYDGATFKPAQISEAGRQHLGQLLGALSDEQIRALFTIARFDEPRGLMRHRYAIPDWVLAFKAKVRQIIDGPPCPSST